MTMFRVTTVGAVLPQELPTVHPQTLREMAPRPATSRKPVT